MATAPPPAGTAADKPTRRATTRSERLAGVPPPAYWLLAALCVATASYFCLARPEQVGGGDTKHALLCIVCATHPITRRLVLWPVSCSPAAHPAHPMGRSPAHTAPSRPCCPSRPQSVRGLFTKSAAYPLDSQLPNLLRLNGGAIMMSGAAAAALGGSGWLRMGPRAAGAVQAPGEGAASQEGEARAPCFGAGSHGRGAESLLIRPSCLTRSSPVPHPASLAHPPSHILPHSLIPRPTSCLTRSSPVPHPASLAHPPSHDLPSALPADLLRAAMAAQGLAKTFLVACYGINGKRWPSVQRMWAPFGPADSTASGARRLSPTAFSCVRSQQLLGPMAGRPPNKPTCRARAGTISPLLLPMEFVLHSFAAAVPLLDLLLRLGGGSAQVGAATGRAAWLPPGALPASQQRCLQGALHPSAPNTASAAGPFLHAGPIPPAGRPPGAATPCAGACDRLVRPGAPLLPHRGRPDVCRKGGDYKLR